jgi:hypothetical protein
MEMAAAMPVSIKKTLSTNSFGFSNSSRGFTSTGLAEAVASRHHQGSGL